MAGRRLSLAEREEIMAGVVCREPVRQIAARLGRAPSTVSREVRRNLSAPRRYRAFPAHIQAMGRARRDRPRKLAPGTPVRAQVVRLLGEQCSPGQIAGRLQRDYPGQPELQVSHETIYQALFVQGKGSLRAEVDAALRCGRARRRRRRDAPGRGGHHLHIPGMISISDRPAEAADRAVPGHREGDLIIGAGARSAVATLAERTTRYCLIVALPGGRHGAEAVRDAIASAITTLPEQLRRSLTWDQGAEMASHAQLRIDTGIQIYFCDPHSPWQRGTNENTNGLLRQYFPKGTDLSRHTPGDLAAVAAALNGRPRKTLGWKTPAEALDKFLYFSQQGGVATIPGTRGLNR